MTAMRQKKGRINGHKSRKSYIRKVNNNNKKKPKSQFCEKANQEKRKNTKMQITEKHPTMTGN